MGARDDYSDNLMPGTSYATIDAAYGIGVGSGDLEPEAYDRYCSWCGLWMDEAEDADDANGTPAEQAEERICADCVTWLAGQGGGNGMGGARDRGNGNGNGQGA